MADKSPRQHESKKSGMASVCKGAIKDMAKQMPDCDWGAAGGGDKAAGGGDMKGGGDKPATVVNPTDPAPSEPVVAYVHDAARGEVTVMSGTLETTYRDPALVKRLLDAAPGASLNGGEASVITP